uniref:Uncharacterized protein n=1 Tax=Pinguiococcus pyrenoidosus TaxID=172671 RepID=A0A7R9U4V6_9STRA
MQRTRRPTGRAQLALRGARERLSSEDDSPTAEAAQAASAAEEEEDAPESPRFKRNVSENSQIPKGVDLPPERRRRNMDAVEALNFDLGNAESSVQEDVEVAPRQRRRRPKVRSRVAEPPREDQTPPAAPQLGDAMSVSVTDAGVDACPGRPVLAKDLSQMVVEADGRPPVPGERMSFRDALGVERVAAPRRAPTPVSPFTAFASGNNYYEGDPFNLR